MSYFIPSSNWFSRPIFPTQRIVFFKVRGLGKTFFRRSLLTQLLEAWGNGWCFFFLSFEVPRNHTLHSGRVR